MTEQPSGLRFDIYERVHLAENMTGIKELDEIELVPHIQVNVEQEQAVLKGNLWLTGSYRGEAGDASQTLEHLIPVEITMPLNRIQRLEDIAVEIDNFDVDLLSSRSLNVTGVLSLRGIEMRAGGEELSFAEEEEVVFVHQEQEFRAAGGDAAAGPAEQQNGRERLFPEDFPDSPNDYENLDNAVFTEEKEETEEAAEEAADSAQEDDGAEWQENAGNTMDLTVTDEDEAKEAAAGEKKEVKLAFSSKAARPDDPPNANPLKSLLHKDARHAATGTAAAVAEPQTATPDALQWKSLFLHRENEEERFRRMRMCIVQKEETLETIAERYRINPREILLYNRLNEQALTEGQVIYIPQK